MGRNWRNSTKRAFACSWIAMEEIADDCSQLPYHSLRRNTRSHPRRCGIPKHEWSVSAGVRFRPEWLTPRRIPRRLLFRQEFFDVRDEIVLDGAG